MEEVSGDQHQQTGKGEFAAVVDSHTCMVAAEAQGGQLLRRYLLELDADKSLRKPEWES